MVAVRPLHFSDRSKALRISIRSFAPVLLLLSASCVQTCYAPDVATAVARLTTLNADALTNALNADTTCGFGAPAVLVSPTFDPAKIGTVSTITWTVKDCVIDFGTAGAETSKNCQGKTTRAFGKATVSGTKTVTGYLTGNALQPVIPEGPDSVEITLDGTFDNFRAEKDGGAATMTWISGGLSGKLRPRLAQGKTGACSVQTKNTAFSEVAYKASKAHIKSTDNEVDVDIQASSLSGQNGKGPAGENLLTGKITIWDEEHAIPVEGETGGLDPDYKADVFVSEFQCGDELASPLSFTCDLKPMLAQNAARGLTKLVAAATSLVDADTTCGFSSPSVGAKMTQQGTPGGTGSVTLSTAENPCAIELPEQHKLSTDCKGSEMWAKGSLSAKSTKEISGFLTGQPQAPVVPLTRQSTVISHLALDLQAFTVFDKSADGKQGPSFTFTGTLQGKVKPVAGEKKNQPRPDGGPLYSVKTPVVAFEDVVTATGTLLVVSDGNHFTLDVQDLEFSAFNGTFGGKSNALAGKVTVNGTAFPALPDPRLDPAFDQAAFDASYACNPELKEVVPAN